MSKNGSAPGVCSKFVKDEERPNRWGCARCGYHKDWHSPYWWPGGVVRRVLCLLLFVTTLAWGQTLSTAGVLYTSFAAKANTGAGTAFKVQTRLGQGLGSTAQVQSQVYEITWTIQVTTGAGSVTAGQWNLEGSLDNTLWLPIAAINVTDAQWKTDVGELQHVAYKPVNYVRMNAVSITGGGAVTGKFQYYYMGSKDL
jgi:hypothetical protein